LGLALATGIGALLITTGVYLGAGRVWLDIGRPPGSAPRFYSYLIRMPPVVGAMLSIGAVGFIFLVCKARCLKLWQGVVTALVTLAFAAYLKLAPGVLWLLLPAVFLGVAMNGSLGFYIGGALQLALGAWLIGWLHRGE
jgi:hypothetical protein